MCLYLLHSIRKCSSSSVQWEHSRSSLALQLCLCRPSLHTDCVHSDDTFVSSFLCLWSFNNASGMVLIYNQILFSLSLLSFLLFFSLSLSLFFLSFLFFFLSFFLDLPCCDPGLKRPKMDRFSALWLQGRSEVQCRNSTHDGKNSHYAGKL